MSIHSVSVIWGFAVPGVALNTARDLGGRFWAMTIWGSAGKNANDITCSKLGSLI